MALGKIIEQVSANCRCKNDKSTKTGFLITSLYPFLYLVSGQSLSNHLKYFNDTLQDGGQCGMSHERMTTLVDFLF